MKKHLIVSFGGGGLDHLCGQRLLLKEGEAYGKRHVVFKWKDVTCRKCLAIGRAVREGRKAPHGLSKENLFWKRGKFPRAVSSVG